MPDGPPDPPPLPGRVYYVFGGTLPTAYGPWVARDLTGRGWRLRQALRPLFMVVPFAVIFALLPGAPQTRLSIVLFLLVAALGLGFATSGHFRNRRLVAHGFAPVLPAEEDPGTTDEDPPG